MTDYTLNDALTELERGNRLLMMVRHAERPKISDDDPTFGEILPITAEGQEMSYRLGEAFRAWATDVQFYSSPLRRTTMTAEWIARGLGIDNPDIPTDEKLGNSSFYFADQLQVYETFRTGGFFDKVFSYMATGHLTGFNELHAATDALEDWCLAHFTHRLAFFTTHDLYNAAFLHARGIETHFTRNNWPRFLDSAAIIVEPNGTRRYAFVRAGFTDRYTGV